MPHLNASILVAALVAGGLVSSSMLTAAAPARLYLTFVSHNEDSNNALCAPVNATRARYLANRAALLQVAETIYAGRGAYDLQSDWEWILNYHTRPPQPYHVNYDWYGLGALTHTEQYDIIRSYETHGLDMTTGQPDARPGSYQYYGEQIGCAPRTVGDLAENSIQMAADTVFRDLGARMCVVHGRATNLGDSRNGLWTRPEHVDFKLFEYIGQDPRPILEAAFVTARATQGARTPYVVGVKMHDNDFFAQDSAWVTVYQQSRRTPPWDTSRQSPRIPWETTLAMWSLWDSLVRYAAAQQIAVVNSAGVLRMLPSR